MIYYKGQEISYTRYLQIIEREGLEVNIGRFKDLQNRNEFRVKGGIRYDN